MIDEFTVFQEVLPSVSIKLGVALLCGFLLGMERETKEKPAGLRTIILITVGSALFMIVSDLIARVTESPADITRVDPSRIASQVVTGIGFLGAGAILQSHGSVRGLTTAATIWVAAGIGLCVGVGFPTLGVGITLLVLAVLVVMDPLREFLSRRGEEMRLRLVIPNDGLVLRRLWTLLQSNEIPERDIRIEPLDDELLVDFTYRARRGGRHHLLDELAEIERLRGEPWTGGPPEGRNVSGS